MELREPLVMASAGRRGTGKSVETIDFIYKYLVPDPTVGRHARKVLIFDINREFNDFDFKGQRHHIKRLYLKDLAKFSALNFIEVRRIEPLTDANRLMGEDELEATLKFILKYYRNGLLHLEDINGIFGDNIPQEFISTLATARHKGIDITFNVQGIGRLGHPKLMSNINCIRLHKTHDSVLRHADKFKEKTDILCLAENIVDTRYQYGARNKTVDQYFHVYVFTDKNKILGNFSKEEAYAAIDKHLETIPKRPGINKIKLREYFFFEFFDFS